MTYMKGILRFGGLMCYVTAVATAIVIGLFPFWLFLVIGTLLLWKSEKWGNKLDLRFSGKKK